MPHNLMKLKGQAETLIGLDLSDSSITSVLKFSDGNGATVGAFTNDTIGTTTEDGYISIDVGGTVYKIPFWADNA